MRIATSPRLSAEGGAPKILTRDFDEDANLLDWGPDGIYFTALQKTNAHIYRLDPARGAVRRLTGPDAFRAAAAFTKDHRFCRDRARRTESFRRDLRFLDADFAPRYLTIWARI